MSLRPSTGEAAVACSGLMYAAVPIGKPTPVSVAPPARPIARATPKSATTACPFEMRMFSGLMSRWITPRRCA